MFLDVETELERARTALRDARRVVLITGGGLVVPCGLTELPESGRSEWAGVAPEKVATSEAFRADPGFVWRWFDWRRRRAAVARLHAGHEALGELAVRLERVLVISQTTDGLLERVAGLEVIEMFGSLWRTRCTGCGRVREDRRSGLGAELPRCDHCGALVRPDVTWFGEAVAPAVMESAHRAACLSDVFVSVGCGDAVEPAASLAGLARENGAVFVAIEARPGPLVQLADIGLVGSVVDLLAQAAGITPASESVDLHIDDLI